MDILLEKDYFTVLAKFLWTHCVAIFFLAGISWLKGNAECLPVKDNNYDVYTVAFGIRNMTHIDKVGNMPHIDKVGIYSLLTLPRMAYYSVMW